jgi:outer membrane protein TolC
MRSRPPTPTSARRARRSSEHRAHRLLWQREQRSVGVVPGGHTAGVSRRSHLPIFSGGANLRALDLANVRKRIEIAHYEQSIQVAFREVADALVARATLDDQLRAQEALTRAQRAQLQARRRCVIAGRRQLSQRADRAARSVHRAAPAHRSRGSRAR